MKYILPILVMFLLFGCSDQSKKEVKEVSKKAQNIDVKKVVAKSANNVNAISESTKSTDVPKVIKEATKKVKEITKIVIAKSGNITTNITKKIGNVLNSAQKEPATQSIDGSSLFASKCSSCHGAKAQKHALGQSEVIAGWSIDKVKNALIGYKNGTYGKNMKIVMKGQVAPLSEADILALAVFISKQ